MRKPAREGSRAGGIRLSVVVLARGSGLGDGLDGDAGLSGELEVDISGDVGERAGVSAGSTTRG
jgi:hypothetical protein